MDNSGVSVRRAEHLLFVFSEQELLELEALLSLFGHSSDRLIHAAAMIRTALDRREAIVRSTQGQDDIPAVNCNPDLPLLG
jgi:hypothetical protein